MLLSFSGEKKIMYTCKKKKKDQEELGEADYVETRETSGGKAGSDERENNDM